MKLLLAEDDADLSAIVAKKLRAEGYELTLCASGTSALDALVAGEFDVAVLDINMPGLSGLDVVRELRDRAESVPAIFLTARDTVADRVAGLDAGASDYLVKPFSLAELSARIRAVARTAGRRASGELAVADLVLNTETRTVTRAGEPVNLTAREFSLLEYLMLNAGRVLPRERIEARVWGYEGSASSNVVDVYIGYVRAKVDGGHERKLIHTVRGVGFVLRDEGER